MDGTAAGNVPAQRAFDVTHRLVLSIAVPMTLGFLTTPLLGITGTAVVGRMGLPEALAGLAIGAILFDLIFASFNFLRSSTTGLVAQAFGRNDATEQQAIFLRALLTALCLGFLILLLSPVLLPAGLAIMTTDPNVADVTSSYFSIRVLASPMAFANYAILGFFLGRGEAFTGLCLQIILNGTNIVLSIFLGLGLGWGVAGVAWGTFAGETTGAIAGLFLVLRRFPAIHQTRRQDIFDAGKLQQLFSLNLDILIRSFVLTGSFALMTRIGSGLGPVTLAANAVLMNFLMLSAFFLDGLANAAEQLAGRAIGANCRPAFQQALKLTGLWSFAMAGLLSLFFLGFGDPIVRGLTTSNGVRDAAALYIPWAALTGLTGVLAFQMDGVFIGATWSREMRNMMLAAFVGYCLALALFVPLLANHGLWLAMNLFLLMRGLFLLAMVPRKMRQSFLSAH